MDGLTKLKRERTALRRTVSVSINNVNTILEKETVSGSDDSGDRVSRLQSLQSLIKSKQSKLESLDSQICVEVSDEDFEKEVDEAHSYEQNIFLTLTKIANNLSLEEKPSSNQNRESDQNLNISNLSNSSNKNVKLPKLDIPLFSGDPLQYQAFRQNFLISIDSNQNLEDVEKFLYLKNLLKGDALSAIQGLEITNSNYQEALKTIQRRFGDNKLLVSSFVNVLMKLSPVKSSQNVSKLRDLFDCINNCVQNLKSLNINSDDYGAVLIPCILEKLPNDLRLDITKSINLANWNFEDLLSALNKEVQAREACQFVSSSHADNPTSHSDVKREVKTNSALFHASATNRKFQNQACVFCNDSNHKPWECNKVGTVAQRKTHINNKKLCFNCLKPSHQSKNCRSQYSCRNCGQRHNTAICEQTTQVNSSDLAETETLTNHRPDVSNVFLKTALTTVVNSEGSRNQLVRVLFDEGSQKSYIGKPYVISWV